MLLAKIPATTSSPWHSIDQEEFFKQNLAKSEPNWIYRNKEIFYSFNSNGYRCPEWSDINWHESIVVLGCSYVAGVGLAFEDTFCSLLSKQLNQPVVNLGVASSSNHLMLHNSLNLLDAGIKPKAVIVLYTDIARLTFFKQDKPVKHYGHWVFPDEFHFQPENALSMPAYPKDELDFYSTWITENNADVHGLMIAKSIENAWRANNVPFYGFSAYESQMDADYTRLMTMIDRARDLRHPGIETQKIWTRIILDKLGKNHQL